MPLLSFTLCLPLIPNLSATYTLLISLHILENCHILSSILSVTLKVKYCKLLSSYPQKKSSFVYMWLLHLQIQIGHYKQCPKHCWCRPLLVLHGRLVHLVNEPLQFDSYPERLKDLYWMSHVNMVYRKVTSNSRNVTLPWQTIYAFLRYPQGSVRLGSIDGQLRRWNSEPVQE